MPTRQKTVEYKEISMPIKDKLSVDINDFEEDFPQVRIVGTKEALTALAHKILALAEMNVEDYDIPKGAFLHEHLFPNIQLTKKSVSLEICQKYPKQ